MGRGTKIKKRKKLAWDNVDDNGGKENDDHEDHTNGWRHKIEKNASDDDVAADDDDHDEDGYEDDEDVDLVASKPQL